VFSRKNKPHTLAQLDFMYNKFESVIDMFDEKSLNEIGGGYSGDVDKLMGVIEEETIKIFDSVPEPISSDRFYNLENVSESIHESLKILNYNYFKVTMLPEFYIGQHSIEWGNVIQIYDRTCILASRGLGKCFSPETEVLMYNGTLKEIKDIVVGDLVMGKDSTPRKILNTYSGIDDMYEINQSTAISYLVNSEHILHFKRGKWHNDIRRYVDSDTKVVEKNFI